MPSRSVMARLQQATTLALLFAAFAWLAWQWNRSPLWAVAGFLAIAMGYSVVLAAEFLALRFVGPAAAMARPRWTELARAWWGETITAPQVFCWRQPFRWRAVPDCLQAQPGRRGAVFIHGFLGNRGFWTPWLERLRVSGHCFVAINLEPVFGSIDEYVPIIEDAVRRVTAATGMPPVLVCHSMGGLAARAWLASTAGGGRVHRVITIGSPHHGTWLGQFSHLENGRQMRLGSEWLQALERRGGAVPPGAGFTCWYSNCDNIVFPVATAMLAGAENRPVRGVAHVHLAFHPLVMEETLAIITRPGD